MAENKKSFVLYADLLKVVEQLPDEIAGKLFKIILRYVNDLEICVDDLLLRIAFEPIKLQLYRDLQKWDVIKEKRSIAGKKSAEIKKLNATNSTLVESVETDSTNSTVNDNVNDNVTVNVNDNVTVTVINEKRGRFTPPTLLDVQLFILEKKLIVNADTFWNFYESKNWMVGKNKMKDWKKAIAGWESRDKQKTNQNGNTATTGQNRNR